MNNPHNEYILIKIYYKKSRGPSLSSIVSTFREDYSEFQNKLWRSKDSKYDVPFHKHN
jgi:hypothetical protein